MVEIICEFIVKEEARGRIELAYGPGGDWSRLFDRCPGFRGITVLRDAKNPRHYLTIELWLDGTQREQSLAENAAEYAALEAGLEEWAESRTEIGTFSVRAEATVRPRGKTRRSQSP